MALYPNTKVVPIWTLPKGSIFSWSITLEPKCRLLGFNYNICMYEYSYLDSPHIIHYSLIKRTVCLPKNIH